MSDVRESNEVLLEPLRRNVLSVALSLKAFKRLKHGTRDADRVLQGVLENVNALLKLVDAPGGGFGVPPLSLQELHELSCGDREQFASLLDGCADEDTVRPEMVFKALRLVWSPRYEGIWPDGMTAGEMRLRIIAARGRLAAGDTP